MGGVICKPSWSVDYLRRIKGHLCGRGMRGSYFESNSPEVVGLEKNGDGKLFYDFNGMEIGYANN